MPCSADAAALNVDCETRKTKETVMDWPTALVLIAVIIAVMAIATTYLNGRFSNK